MKLKPGHTPEAVEEKAAKILRLAPEQIASCNVVKQSIDARKKPEIWFSYVVDVTLKNGSEENVIRRCRNNSVSLVEPVVYRFPEPGTQSARHRPVIIGMGPAGLLRISAGKSRIPPHPAGTGKGCAVQNQGCGEFLGRRPLSA